MTNAGNFATVAASHSNSQVVHSTSTKTPCKVEHYSCTIEETSEYHVLFTNIFLIKKKCILSKCETKVNDFAGHGNENGLLSSSSTSSVTSNPPQPISQQHSNPSLTQTSHILHSQQNQNHNCETEISIPVPPSSSPHSSVSSSSSPLPVNSCSPAPSSANGLISKLPDGLSSLKSIAQQVIVRAGLEIPSSETNRNIFDNSKSNINNNNITSEAHIPPLLGVAPLGTVPLQKEHQHQFQMMEAAYYHMPHPSDSERLRAYLPRNICPTPSYYQQVSLFFPNPLSTKTVLVLYFSSYLYNKVSFFYKVRKIFNFA